MEIKIELMQLFLDGGIEAVFTDKKFRSKVKNSKGASREEKLIKMLGCEMTVDEFYGYLISSESRLNKYELEMLGDIKYDYDPVKVDQELVESKRILNFLPYMMNIDLIGDMADFIRSNPDFENMTENKLKELISKRKKEQVVDPMQLLFELDAAKKSGAKGKDNKTPLQALSEFIEESGKIDEVSNILMLVSKSDKQSNDIYFKNSVTIKSLLKAMYLQTEHVYENEYEWFVTVINKNIWNIYMLPYLPDDRREESKYFIPFLEVVSRKNNMTPRQLLKEIISLPEPVIKEEYTIFGTIFKDTVFIKDGKMAVIDETIIEELNIDTLDFDNRGLVENGVPVKDVHFKFQEGRDNYLIKRGVV